MIIIILVHTNCILLLACIENGNRYLAGGHDCVRVYTLVVWIRQNMYIPCTNSFIQLRAQTLARARVSTHLHHWSAANSEGAHLVVLGCPSFPTGCGRVC